MHLAESKVQAQVGLSIYGKTQTAYLDDLNLLGPNFVGAHCVWLDDDDIRRFSDRGGTITHQPCCNLRIGSGIAPVRRFLNAGITVGIGTDGSSSSDNQNMFDALRFAANVSRVMDFDHKNWIAAVDALRMGTLSGARLLGFEGRLGRIAPGFLADIVFLDLSNVNYVPLTNPIHQLIQCEDSSAVNSVMIGGKMVVENGKFTKFDFATLRRKVERSMARLNDSTITKKKLAMQLEPLVSSYCSGLRQRPYSVTRTVQ
jgi:cytosine/adenosine deaminase-related metal-dependent hydrolase